MKYMSLDKKNRIIVVKNIKLNSYQNEPPITGSDLIVGFISCAEW
jgi:hypothetical protein